MSEPAVSPIHDRSRVAIANRADGGIAYWIGKLYGFAALVGVTATALFGFILYSYFSVRTDDVGPGTRHDLAAYSKTVPAVSRMYAADGTLLGEFAQEWREVVPYEAIPKQLVDAFLAVEDHDYFNHRGLYFKGIARAVWTNITAGDFAQGGSTITQQVAKQFLGSEKSLSRKAKEAILARRLEATYSKRAILAVYLNHIYLGAGAWGVAAAARRYFQKDLDQLTLDECAMIAGLAKAPTAYSPVHRPKVATDRRNIVLEKMALYGFASRADVDKAKATPIKLDMYRDVFPDRMPYYAEQIRRYMTERYALQSEGLRVETAAEPTWEAAAYANADYGAHNQDKRQGWRGPEWRIDGAARATFLERQKQLYGNGPLVRGKRYLALVDKVGDDKAELLIGDKRVTLPMRGMSWAAKWEAGNAENDKTIESPREALKSGYVVWVSRETKTIEKFREYGLPDKINPSWVYSDNQKDWDEAHTDVVRLEQVPHPQTTIFTGDHRTGYVVAMVGGYDYDRSVFNRAVQACRQPGSTYKPIYYALGLDEGYGFDTVLNDIPVQIVDPDTGAIWTPTNLGDTQDGNVSLEYALVFSKNVPSIDLFKRLGAKNVEKWARRLGFTTKIIPDDALALGASCTKVDEMARAFTIFARNGKWWPRPVGQEKDWIYVRRILDRDGNTIEDNTAIEDPQLGLGDRFDRFAVLAGIQPKEAIPARSAFLTSKLLASEVEFGFANILRATGLIAAGKTGTSSATHDNWFIGYTSKFTTVVWMGDDKKQRALGKKDAAYMTVVPLWARYMYEAAKGYPNPKIPWETPPGVKPGDRGDHSKGEKGPQMDLIWHSPKRDADTGADDRPPV
ncbi:MAG TPA: transglycosylase domain-containing protein [Kofleriaceae bacterium]|nr:transglycosylase domain-containing protein [Kofleriaceae bacterium]